eukprot:9478559-Pyramimonas_sp.AAC.1
MVRILKHGGGHDEAIKMARSFRCDICDENKLPKPSGTVSGHRILEFNKQVGLDCMNIPGWKGPTHTVPALNIVDDASSFQTVAPLLQGENSGTIREGYRQFWKRWAGPAERIVVDAGKANIGTALTDPLELEQTEIVPVAGEGQWQNGKTESHGGWWKRVFKKLLETAQPQNYEEWAECVDATTDAKQRMLRVDGYSPYQHVLGQEPRLPGDLLQDQIDVVSAAGPLYDTACARSRTIRQHAMQALLQARDDQDLRRAVAARNRVTHPFQPGDKVAYWRKGKKAHARWHGRGILIGQQGRNWWLSHRGHLIRADPSQLRPASTSEVQADHLVEQVLQSEQQKLSTVGGHLHFLDLTRQECPPGVSAPDPESAPAEGPPEVPQAAVRPEGPPE